MQPVIAYLATGVVFFLIDFVWLAYVAKAFYRDQLGHLMRDEPNLAVAAVFYLAYVGGIVFLAVMPALQGQSLRHAVLAGAVLGLVAYGTYDVTNLATLRDWPVTMSLVDIVWGTVLTAVSATAGYLIARALA